MQPETHGKRPVTIILPLPVELNDWLEDLTIEKRADAHELVARILQKAHYEKWVPDPATPPGETVWMRVRVRYEVFQWLETLGARYLQEPREMLIRLLWKALREDPERGRPL